MDSNKTPATKGLGLIIATILNTSDQAQPKDPNKSSNNENDLREQRQAENPSSNPDPEVEDPNFVPDDQDNENTDLKDDVLDEEEDKNEQDELDPIDPINELPEEDADPEDKDPLEIPGQDENERDEIERDDEAPVEEKDDLGQNSPREFPEEEQDDFFEERDFADQNNTKNKDFDHNDQDLEATGLEAEDNGGNFL